jgi:hypothetical protein
MLRNVPKRMGSDAWSLETTTAPTPGENSVAEKTLDYGLAIVEGREKRDPAAARLFLFHRQASDVHDLTTDEGITAAVVEASGPELAARSDIPNIVAQWHEADADKAFLERVWLNRLVRSSQRAFDALRFGELAREGYVPPDGAVIVVGFDGARYEDAAALVACEIPTGFVWPLGVWEKPPGPLGAGWEVPEAEVEEALEAAMGRWDVWRVYADPPYWESTVAAWAGKYGEQRIVAWRMNQWTKVAAACRAFDSAIAARELSHSGDAALVRHVGNACRLSLHSRGEDGRPLWVIVKERPDSPNKIDAAAAGVIGWQARLDAITEGIGGESLYEAAAREAEEARLRGEDPGELIDAW